MGSDPMAVHSPWGQAAKRQDSADNPHAQGRRIVCSYSSAGGSVAPQHPVLHLRAGRGPAGHNPNTKQGTACTQVFRLPNNLNFNEWEILFLPSLKEMNL